MAPIPTPIPLWSLGEVLNFLSFSKPTPERLSSQSRSGFSSNPVYEENFELRPLTRDGPELPPPTAESYPSTPTNFAPAPRIPLSAPARRVPFAPFPKASSALVPAPAPRASSPSSPAAEPPLVPLLVSFVEDSSPQLPGLDLGPVFQVPVWPGAPPPQIPGLDFGPTFQITSWPASTVRGGHTKRDLVSPDTEFRPSTSPYFAVFALLFMFVFVFIARFSRLFRP